MPGGTASGPPVTNGPVDDVVDDASGGAVVDDEVGDGPGPGGAVVGVVGGGAVVDVVDDVVLPGGDVVEVVGSVGGGGSWARASSAPTVQATTRAHAMATVVGTRRIGTFRIRHEASESCPESGQPRHSAWRNRAILSAVGGWVVNRLANWI